MLVNVFVECEEADFSMTNTQFVVSHDFSIRVRIHDIQSPIRAHVYLFYLHELCCEHRVQHSETLAT